MLATFVIGLREGLEAALIVGIIAAFLKQNGRSDALKRMWFGVAVAVLLCLGVGVLLQSINSSLPQRQQEMLECVVAAIAVVMVSYMVLWMRAHSRSLKSDLQHAAGGALASGSATALVVMAFLAVFREGFETAVFLLAAFQSAVSPAAAVAGAVLGIVIAVGLGYLVYRGGVKLNLAKFFRITGAVLVLVAAGLVMSTLRAAYEAGWLVVGQQHAISLAVIARPGTVQESLLTGVLGIRSSMPIIEVIAYLLYLVPMLFVVLWPARRALTSLQLGRVLGGVATGALVLAACLLVLAPSAGSVSAASLQVSSSTTGVDPSTGADLPGKTGTSTITVGLDSSVTRLTVSGSLSGESVLQLSGHVRVGGISAAQYAGTAVTSPVDASAAGLPVKLTLGQVAAISNGRLPIGLSTSGNSGAAVTASYTDAWTPTVTIDPSTGTVIDVDASLVRSMVLENTDGARFPGVTLTRTDLSATDAAVAGQVTAASEVTDRRADHEVLGEVIPGLLALFGVILLGFGLPPLLRRRSRSGQQADSAAASTGAHEQLTPVPLLPVPSNSRGD